jgi:hypothetical protein
VRIATWKCMKPGHHLPSGNCRRMFTRPDPPLTKITSQRKATMAAPDGNQKAAIYETLSALNTAFAGIVPHLQTLQQTGLFKSKPAKFCRVLSKSYKTNAIKNSLRPLRQSSLRTGTDGSTHVLPLTLVVPISPKGDVRCCRADTGCPNIQ